MAVVGGVFSLNADYSAFTRTIPEVEELPAMQQEDTIVTRYPVAKTVPEEYNDLLRHSPASWEGLRSRFRRSRSSPP